MPIDIPHLAFPPAIVNGRFAVVDQNSDEEITGSADAALLCPQGHRPLLRRYGVPNVQQTRTTVNRGALLAAAVVDSEPRITQVVTTEEIEVRASTIAVKVGRG